MSVCGALVTVLVMPARAGPEANVYALRPSWSFPAESWITLDPRFWRSSSEAK
jgi:hypothetical protein